MLPEMKEMGKYCSEVGLGEELVTVKEGDFEWGGEGEGECGEGTGGRREKGGKGRQQDQSMRKRRWMGSTCYHFGCYFFAVSCHRQELGGD